MVFSHYSFTPLPSRLDFGIAFQANLASCSPVAMLSALVANLPVRPVQPVRRGRGPAEARLRAARAPAWRHGGGWWVGEAKLCPTNWGNQLKAFLVKSGFILQSSELMFGDMTSHCYAWIWVEAYVKSVQRVQLIEKAHFAGEAALLWRDPPGASREAWKSLSTGVR